MGGQGGAHPYAVGQLSWSETMTNLNGTNFHHTTVDFSTVKLHVCVCARICRHSFLKKYQRLTTPLCWGTKRCWSCSRPPLSGCTARDTRLNARTTSGSGDPRRTSTAELYDRAKNNRSEKKARLATSCGDSGVSGNWPYIA